MTKTLVSMVRYTCDVCGHSWTPRKAAPANKYGGAVRMCPVCKRKVSDVSTCSTGPCTAGLMPGEACEECGKVCPE